MNAPHAATRPLTVEAIYDFHQWFGASFQGRLGVRAATMYQSLMLAVARSARTLVETGTSRQPGNWQGDGQSTVVLAEFARRYGARLWTCDISAEAIDAARRATSECQDHVEYVVGDSVAFLRGFQQPIDFAYFDSFDFDQSNPAPSQEHALSEGGAALPRLHNGSVVVIDDCALPAGGKGGLLIPWLLGQGWQVIGLQYQVVMTVRLPG